MSCSQSYIAMFHLMFSPCSLLSFQHVVSVLVPTNCCSMHLHYDIQHFFWGVGGNTGRFSNVNIFSLQEKTLNLDDSRNWVVGIMVSTTIVKFLLMVYCRTFSNEIVRAYAQDHFFDVVTNLIGLIASVLASIFFWWIDPAGAILVLLSYFQFATP